MIIKQFNNNQENVTTYIKNNSGTVLRYIFYENSIHHPYIYTHRVLKVYTRSDRNYNGFVVHQPTIT